VIFLAAPAVALAQSRFNVGTPLSQQEIRGFDFMIGPDGKELPPGHGSPKEGSAVFAKRCATGRMAKGEQSGG
jgi:cytochrome c